MAIISIIVGLAILFLGWKLFWFFVAAGGFILAYTYGPQNFRMESPGFILLVAVMTGILGALLALFLKRVAIAVSGFIAGGYAAVELFRSFRVSYDPDSWQIYILGGIIGALR